ncbi:MAG: WbqC family protein [Muribaculaceae bacterium]|nr:WbqC family protein [Muribaculaceae bacterium]
MTTSAPISITLPPALLPAACYYAAIARAGSAGIAMQATYDKRRKETHRYTIADARGPLTLTVPVQPPHGIPRARWTQVALSDHGRWQDVHAQALASAYGRTPYYEHYIPRLAPALFAPGGTPLSRQIEALNRIVLDILLIDTPISYAPEEVLPMPGPASAGPHWQLRASSMGFLPGLSILDLIFNLGPEAALYIRRDFADGDCDFSKKL